MTEIIDLLMRNLGEDVVIVSKYLQEGFEEKLDLHCVGVGNCIIGKLPR